MAEILVIEEQASLRERLIGLFRRQGIKAVGAADGRTGVELARQLRPSVVLCDMALRNLNGIGVLCVLKQQACMQHSRIVMMMPEQDRTLQEQVLKLGADATVGKPASLPCLLRTVQDQLAAR